MINGRSRLLKNSLYLCSCVCMHRICVCGQSLCICMLSSCTCVHVHKFIWTLTPVCAHVGTQKLNFFVQYDSFSLFSLFSLSNHDSHAPFHPFLQVLPSFTGRGSTSCISSWYRALTKDTKALVHDLHN